MKDEIIREAWNIKDTIGSEVNYNLRSLGAMLRKRQSEKNKQVVDLSPSAKQQRMTSETTSQQ